MEHDYCPAHEPSRPIEAILRYGTITFTSKKAVIEAADHIRHQMPMHLSAWYSWATRVYYLANTFDDQYALFVSPHYMWAID